MQGAHEDARERAGAAEMAAAAPRPAPAPVIIPSRSAPIRRRSRLRAGTLDMDELPTVHALHEKAVRHGQARAVPVRARTRDGLYAALLGAGLVDLGRAAVVLDFDKVIACDPGAGPLCLAALRGGQSTRRALHELREARVPLFVATARKSEERLQEMHAFLRLQGCAEFFGEAHWTASGLAVDVEESLGVKVRRITGTRMFSAGMEKGKLLAHVAARHVPQGKSQVVFVDDNVFHAYFVLQETPELFHSLWPGRELALLSIWWDTAEEQQRGQMCVRQDSDFSYVKDYEQCLDTFGVGEEERVRTAEDLVRHATLQAQKAGATPRP